MDIASEIITSSAAGMYKGTPLELSVETLTSFLIAYETSGSIDVACTSLGIRPYQILRRAKVDSDFSERLEEAKQVIYERAMGKLVDGAINGIVEKTWEEGGVKYTQRPDYRYLDRLLKETEGAEKHAGGIRGTVLQVNISGLGVSTPPKVVQEELDL